MLADNENFLLVNEQFPHIGRKLELLWGHKECADFLHSLFHDTRDGQRQGFPKPVASALFKLLVLHDELFPPKVAPGDIWHPAHTR